MEYWEQTKDRAQKTLPVWQAYLPDMKVGTQGTTELEGLIGGFEPLVQARVAAQDACDEAFRAVQSALLKMKLLGTKVPVLIEGHLEENEGLMDDLTDVYKVNPRTEESILGRVRVLIPVWKRANTAMAGLSPAQPAITRAIQGVSHTVAMLEGILNGYTALVTTLNDKNRLLEEARGALRAHDRLCDRLNKRWYAIVKGGTELSEALAAALEAIPTEPSTPLPDPVEIDHVTQGGAEGLQVLVTPVPGGGAHATSVVVQYTVGGDATEFAHEVPMGPTGAALGPFAEGQTVTLRVKVSNSAGTRTTAPRTIVIAPPIV